MRIENGCMPPGHMSSETSPRAIISPGILLSVSCFNTHWPHPVRHPLTWGPGPTQGFRVIYKHPLANRTRIKDWLTNAWTALLLISELLRVQRTNLLCCQRIAKIESSGVRNPLSKSLTLPKCTCTGDMSCNVTWAAALTILAIDAKWPSHVVSTAVIATSARGCLLTYLWLHCSDFLTGARQCWLLFGIKQSMKSSLLFIRDLMQIQRHPEGMSVSHQNINHFKSLVATQRVLSRHLEKQKITTRTTKGLMASTLTLIFSNGRYAIVW